MQHDGNTVPAVARDFPLRFPLHQVFKKRQVCILSWTRKPVQKVLKCTYLLIITVYLKYISTKVLCVVSFFPQDRHYHTQF